MVAAAAFDCCAVDFSAAAKFAGQQNIIVWDEVTKTEHFIREAKFTTKNKDMGFIAPSPTKPELEEVDPEAFKTLAALQPKRPRWEPKLAASEGMGAAGVTVVAVQDVAGFRATVLKATDSSALAQWMKENQYKTTPGIQKWTEHYIKKRWFLTAFKVLPANGSFSTGLVKMSFQADRPFNPYLVPKENVPEDNNFGLVLYFVGNGTYEPVGSDHDLSPNWRAWVTPEAEASLRRQLKLRSFPQNPSVVAYSDWSFPMSDAKDDIFFMQTGYPEGKRPLPNWLTYGGASFLILGAGYLAARYLRRKRD